MCGVAVEDEDEYDEEDLDETSEFARQMVYYGERPHLRGMLLYKKLPEEENAAKEWVCGKGLQRVGGGLDVVQRQWGKEYQRVT